MAPQEILFDPEAIERESFAQIDREVGPHGYDVRQWPVVRRVIHATADFDFARSMVFAPQALEWGIAALRAGASVLCDTNMALAGVGRSRLERFGVRLACHVADPEVARQARLEGVTRSVVALRRGVADGATVFLIGNAPTALFELLRLAEAGEASPELVIGVPVGFVGAAESKEALLTSGLPAIACRGRKGGTPAAVAILNALLLLAGEEQP